MTQSINQPNNEPTIGVSVAGTESFDAGASAAWAATNSTTDQLGETAYSHPSGGPVHDQIDNQTAHDEFYTDTNGPTPYKL